MGMRLRRAGLILAGVAIAFVCVQRARSLAENRGSAGAMAQSAKAAAESDAAAKLNSVGVAYMGQQRFADAQKEFEAALVTDGNYALATLNLGVALHAQQKSEAARVVLTEATQKGAGSHG